MVVRPTGECLFLATGQVASCIILGSFNVSIMASTAFQITSYLCDYDVNIKVSKNVTHTAHKSRYSNLFCLFLLYILILSYSFGRHTIICSNHFPSHTENCLHRRVGVNLIKLFKCFQQPFFFVYLCNSASLPSPSFLSSRPSLPNRRHKWMQKR